MRSLILKYKRDITILCVGVVLGLLSFMLPFAMFLKIIGAMAVALLIFRNVRIGIAAAAALAPFLQTSYNIALAAICLLSFAASMIFKKDLGLRKSPFATAVLFFAFIVFYNIFITFTPTGSIPVIITYLIFIAVYFMLSAVITERRQFIAICAVLVFTGFVISLYGIYQYFYGVPVNYSWVDKKMFADISIRVFSVFSNPNVLGQYLVLITPIAAGLLWVRKDKLEKLIYICIIAVMLTCLILTLSRGAWLGMMLAIAVFIYLKDKRLLVLGLLVLIVLPFVLPPSILNRFTSIGNLKESSSAYRYSVWLGSIEVFKYYWLAGVGIGSKAFQIVYPSFSITGASYALHAHNFYLQLLIETGIIGFSVFAAMLIAFFRNTYTAARKFKDKTVSTLAISVISGISGYLLYGMFDHGWYDFRMMLMFWVAAALGTSAYNLARDRSEEMTE